MAITGQSALSKDEIARRVKRAEREVAAADRMLRAFQERMPPGA